MNYIPSDMERAEALFRAIAHLCDEWFECGYVSAEEHGGLIDSAWFILHGGTRLP